MPKCADISTFSEIISAKLKITSRDAIMTDIYQTATKYFTTLFLTYIQSSIHLSTPSKRVYL